jgi:hypothetical protein
MEEFRDAIKNCKNKRAPGYAGTVVELTKSAFTALHCGLLYLLNMYWRNGFILEELGVCYCNTNIRKRKQNITKIIEVRVRHINFTKMIARRMRAISEILLNEEQNSLEE